MLHRWFYVVTFKFLRSIVFRESRVTFDTSDTKKVFGPIVIDYTAVQSKVNLKYDNIQKSVLTQFGSHLGDSMNDFFTSISKVVLKLFLI